MTKEEWVKDTVEAVEAAGFEVKYLFKNGPPMIKTPGDMSIGDRMKILKLKLPHGAQKKIYREGVLILPAGMNV